MRGRREEEAEKSERTPLERATLQEAQLSLELAPRRKRGTGEWNAPLCSMVHKNSRKTASCRVIGNLLKELGLERKLRMDPTFKKPRK